MLIPRCKDGPGNAAGPIRRRGSAVISPCARYRYLLTRRVGPQPMTATFIMLNPSSADATTDDPTVRKCVGFCKRWDCGTLQVVNLFAVRATDPADMKAADDPVGPENAVWVDRAVAVSARDPHRRGPVVCAWGVHGAYRDQDLTVLGRLDRLGVHADSLGVTRDGHPRHPLYVPYTARLTPFAGNVHDALGLCPASSRRSHAADRTGRPSGVS